MMLRICLFIASFIVLALIAFGPAINGELITVDDPDLIKALETRNAWNLKRTFVRHNTTGLYYRPLTTLTFTADKLFWDADLRVMHLINIALHILNALMVFLLARFLFGFQHYGWHLSFASAVLFLCHPITAESVNWISGRTDILSATFVFGSALAILQFIRSKHRSWLVGAACLGALGVMAKETAIAFLAGFGFLLWACECPEKITVKSMMRRGALLAGLIAVAGGSAYALLFSMRSFVLKEETSHIALTFRIMDSDWYYSFFVGLRAFGFYVKKIFLPLPLNFAIVEVDALYELLAIPVMLVLIYNFLKRSLAGGYILTGAALISPAFPIAFNQIAWTPYAERYVYIACGFVLPAVVFYVRKLKIDARYVLTGFFVIALFFLGVTSYRSWQWRTNETLWADTVKKSPLSEKALNNYGVALSQQGRYKEAELMFNKAAGKKQFNYKYNDKYDINVAVAMMKREEFQQAREKLLFVIERSKGESNRAVDVFMEIAEKDHAHSDQTLNGLRDQLFELADKTQHAGYFYQLGRVEAQVSNQEMAQDYYKKAVAAARKSDPILGKAEKALEAYKSQNTE